MNRLPRPERRHRLAGLLAGVALLLTGQTAGAEVSVELQSSAIYQRCQAYYLEVERLRRNERHFLIRDASIAFIEELKALEPQSEAESFLSMECLNLANGNAVFAFEEILRLEAEDDEFIEMAYIDATNNANAAQYEYMAEIDRHHDLASDTELALESYKSLVNEARNFAMLRANQSFGIGINSQADVSIYGGSYNAGLIFLQVANMAMQGFHMLASSGGGSSPTLAPSSSTSNSGVTWAPPPGQASSPQTGSGQTPPNQTAAATAGVGGTATASGGPSAAPPANTGAAYDPNAQASAGEDSTLLVLSAPENATLTASAAAPKLDASCADYRITRQDVALAEVTNACQVPISFYWCWVEKEQQSCRPSYLSEVVAPGATIEIAGPSDEETQVANFVVCDMANREQICAQ